MTLAVININDAGIQVGLDGEIIRTSPGYAVVHESKLMTGEAALANARLLPRWTNSRFWSQPSTNPLTNRNNIVRHTADLVFAHLEDLWLPIKENAEQVILAVPGYYTNENLGLLLGISKECGIPVCGVVDQAILAASDLELEPTILHLDIHLHGITLTTISNTGNLVRESVKTVTETGLFTLWDRWANIISKQFIQTTRFDPMFEAATEQYLFDKLPDWIACLGEGNMQEFEMRVASAAHTAAISRDSLLAACSPVYPQIVQAIRAEIPANSRASLLISHRFAGFPGLNSSLGLLQNLDLVHLTSDKYIDAAMRHVDKIVSPEADIAHILTMNTGSSALHIKPVAPRSTTPTHLLWQNHAVAIGASFKLSADVSNGPIEADSPVCILYRRGHELFAEPATNENAAGITLNNQPLKQDSRLHVGDQIQAGDETLTLISVD